VEKPVNYWIVHKFQLLLDQSKGINSYNTNILASQTIVFIDIVLYRTVKPWHNPTQLQTNVKLL